MFVLHKYGLRIKVMGIATDMTSSRVGTALTGVERMIERGEIERR